MTLSRGTRLRQKASVVTSSTNWIAPSGSSKGIRSSLLRLNLKFAVFLIAHFPYALIYGIDQETIVVIAVAHHHREPRYWADRIDTIGDLRIGGKSHPVTGNWSTLLYFPPPPGEGCFFHSYADAGAPVSANGRTSTVPSRTDGIRAAIPMASSRLPASIK